MRSRAVACGRAIRSEGPEPFARKLTSAGTISRTNHEMEREREREAKLPIVSAVYSSETELIRRYVARLIL